MEDKYTKEYVRGVVAGHLKYLGVEELPDNQTLDMLGEYFMDYMMSDDLEYCQKTYWEMLDKVKEKQLKNKE